MASTTIHLAIAKLLEKELNINNQSDYYIGSIIPDIAKIINITRDKTHFVENDKININTFINEYPNYKENNFLLGYYIHLYTDILWYKLILKQVYNDHKIKLLDGTLIDINYDNFSKLIYEDYLHLNAEILSEYNLDLKLFYQKQPIPLIPNFKEFDLNKIPIGLEQLGLYIKNSEDLSERIFDIYDIKNFIQESTNIILSTLKKD